MADRTRDTTHYSGCGARHVECWLRAEKWKAERWALGDPAAIRHVERLLAENERLREALLRILKGTSIWGQQKGDLLDEGEIHDLAANALLAGIEDERVPDRSTK